MPATYFTMTGERGDKNDPQEMKRERYKELFNSESNSDGKYIKILLGSTVMKEGVSLKNIKEIHILDAYFNLTRMDQIKGRGIRYCSHYNVMNEANSNPTVDVYKYVSSLKNSLSNDEKLYKNAEKKYKVIKKIERAMKEVAIDCPLNIHGNIFPEEAKKHKGCGKSGKHKCPAECDFMECEYKCDDPVLNTSKYWDEKNKDYKIIDIKDLDTSTFNIKLLTNEINNAKKRIKDLYQKKFVYELDDIIFYIKSNYPEEQKHLFNEYFVYKALDDLVPITENDFINMKDVLHDKYNRPGYIIHRGKYYIFQPVESSEELPIYYRKRYGNIQTKKLSLKNYIAKKHPKYFSKIDEKVEQYLYDISYYENRPENNIIGILAKEPVRKGRYKQKQEDVFNIKINTGKVSNKKRDKDLPTEMGASCFSKSIDSLKNIAKNMLKLQINNKMKKKELCNLIKNKLLDLERNSKGKNKENLFSYT